MNKYLIEILTALAIVIIVTLLVRMYALEGQHLAVEADDADPAELAVAESTAVTDESAGEAE